MDMSLEDMMSLAVKAHNEGRYSEAERLYRDILNEQPYNAGCMNNLGMIVGGDEAISLFEKAISIAPQEPNTYVNLGYAYVGRERWGEAAVCFEHAQERGQTTIPNIQDVIDRCRRDAILSSKDNFVQKFPWTSFHQEENKSKKMGEKLADYITALPGSGIFASDTLVTYARNLSFLSDSAMMDAIDKSKDPIARGLAWRTAVLVWAARNALKLEGDFVECGTYKGTTARILYDTIDIESTNRTLWLYDVFNWSEGDAHPRLDGLTDSLYQSVLDLFEGATRVRIIKGYVPESFKQGTPEKISFLHIDMNNVHAELGALNELWDRVVPGAMVILDDYGWRGADGKHSAQKVGEDKFFAERGYQVLELPTGQGIILKL